MCAATGLAGMAVGWHSLRMDNRDASELRRWLEEIAQIAAAVNRPVMLETLLDLVAATASRLLGYDFCAVLLPDPSGKALLIEGSYGLSSSYVRQVNADHPVMLETGGDTPAPSSRAFLSHTSVKVLDTVADTTFLPWGGVAREQGYRSMISVPLLVSGNALGTLNCYSRVRQSFGPRETELLAMLADQAGVAIVTARLREREAATIDSLRELNASLETQHELLRQEEAVHEQLTAVALQGGGVDGVAQALAALLGRSVAVTDEPSGELIAAAGHDGGVPAAPAGDAVVEGLDEAHRSAQAVIVDRHTAMVVAPVLLGSETVARMWLPGTLAEFSALDVRALEQATTVCALELLRSRTALEVEWRLSGEVLTDLLTGNPAAATTLTERAQRLGHDLLSPHAVLVAGGHGTGGGLSPHRVLSVVRSLASRSTPRALVTLVGDDVVALWPADQPSEPAARAEELRRLLRRADPEARVTVAIAPPCTALTDYPPAFRRARGALSMARSRGSADGVVSLGSLGLHGLLLQVEDAGELVRFADDMLRPLREQDAVRGTALEETLRVYLENDLNTAATAATLFVHANTVGLRIRRAEQLLGISTSHVLALAELQVALSADQVAAVSPGLESW
ncbi:MAG: Two component domain sensor and regulator [Marmoricola sp.]|nr:Two component domain sensor and regulator [Marmoricola sp.]